VATGVIIETNGRFQYGPTTPSLERSIGELAHVYNERPVTLITAIYKIADSKLQSFSDSFDLREDKP
jgi:hypothetical protein